MAPRPKAPADMLDARELVLYTENDYQLYRSQTLPIIENLAKKKAKGTYTKEGAVKAFGHLVQSAIRKYKKEFPTLDESEYLRGTVNAATKEMAARGLLDTYSEAINDRAAELKRAAAKKKPAARRR